MEFTTLIEQFWAAILPVYIGTVIFATYIFGAMFKLRSKLGKLFTWFVLLLAVVLGILFYWLGWIAGSQPGQYALSFCVSVALYEVILSKIFPTWQAEEKMDKLKTSMK